MLKHIICSFSLWLLTACSNQQTFKVEIFPSLDLAESEPIEKELGKAFEDSFDVTLIGKNRIVTVKNCNDFLRLPDKGFDVDDGADWNTLSSRGIRCSALKWLKTAQSAKKSFFRSKPITADFWKQLPPFMAISTSSEDKQRVAKATDDCVSWNTFDDSLKVASRKDRTFQLIGDGWLGRVSLYAMGDFNSDGFDDLLVRRDGALVGGTLRPMSLFVITKTSDQSCFRLVKKI